jgi:hypothetical protein
MDGLRVREMDDLGRVHTPPQGASSHGVAQAGLQLDFDAFSTRPTMCRCALVGAPLAKADP